MSPLQFVKKINLIQFLISLGLALVIWGFVITTQYPEKTLPPFEINLTDPVAPAGLELVPLSDETQSVRITVSGPENVVNSVTIGQVRPYIDMSGINTPGEHNAPIKLRAGLMPTEVTANLDRRSVPIRLEPRVTKTFKIQVITQGEVNPDYALEGDVQLTPSEVTVEGRQSIVEQIVRAQVVLNLTNRVGPLRTSQQVELVDSRGIRLNDASTTLTISPASVTVAVNISYKLATRTVPIVVVTKGDPSPGFIAGTARANPALLLLTSGSAELLNGINFIETEPVDIASATSEVSRTVRLQVPPNVTAQFDRVQVRIGIVEFQVSRSIDIPLEVVGQSSNLRYSYSPTIIKLTLSGPLLAFTPDLPLDKIRVLLNVQNYDVGVHEIPVQIETPSNLVASAVAPVRVTITRPPPTPTATPVPPTPTSTPTPLPPTRTPTPSPSPTLSNTVAASTSTIAPSAPTPPSTIAPTAAPTTAAAIAPIAANSPLPTSLTSPSVVAELTQPLTSTIAAVTTPVYPTTSNSRISPRPNGPRPLVPVITPTPNPTITVAVLVFFRRIAFP